MIAFELIRRCQKAQTLLSTTLQVISKCNFYTGFSKVYTTWNAKLFERSETVLVDG